MVLASQGQSRRFGDWPFAIFKLSAFITAGGDRVSSLRSGGILRWNPSQGKGRLGWGTRDLWFIANRMLRIFCLRMRLYGRSHRFWHPGLQSRPRIFLINRRSE
jgi:hypothetical protein